MLKAGHCTKKLKTHLLESHLIKLLHNIFFQPLIFFAAPTKLLQAKIRTVKNALYNLRYYLLLPHSVKILSDSINGIISEHF